MSDKLTTATKADDLRVLLSKAQEILKLFQDASAIGYSIEFTPEQWQALVTICEEGLLIKITREQKSNG